MGLDDVVVAVVVFAEFRALYRHQVFPEVHASMKVVVIPRIIVDADVVVFVTVLGRICLTVALGTDVPISIS